MKYAAWLCALLSVAACRSEDSPPSGLQNPVDILSRSQRHTAGRHGKHELGRRVYNFRCYYCHGYSGDARTVASGYLDPKPRDFTRTNPGRVTRERMLDAVTLGRPNTAMKAFAGILTKSEIETVVDFVRQEFMLAKAMNTRYHTKENGWPDHARYRVAFPFALGEIPLATPWEELNAEQQAGKRLFMSSCLTCHERGNDAQTNHVIWDPRPLSFPRGGYSASRALGIDAMTSASPYVIHDRPPKLGALTHEEKIGETLYQANCAFCHAADGSGRNWIGSFLEPHPRDLTNPTFAQGMSQLRIGQVISQGVPNSSMPAWKGVLTPREIRAVAAYVSRAFHIIDQRRARSRSQ